MGSIPFKFNMNMKRRSTLVDLLFVVLFMAIFLLVIFVSGLYNRRHVQTVKFDDTEMVYDFRENDFSGPLYLDNCWYFVPNITNSSAKWFYEHPEAYSRMPYAIHANITNLGFHDLGNSVEWIHTANNSPAEFTTLRKNNRIYYSAAYITTIETNLPNETFYLSIPRINGNIAVYCNGEYDGTLGDSIGFNVKLDTSCGYTSVPVTSDENGKMSLLLISNSDIYVPNPGIVSIPSLDTNRTNTYLIVSATVWLFLMLFTSIVAIMGAMILSKTFHTLGVSHFFIGFMLALLVYLMIDCKYIFLDSLAGTLLKSILLIISGITGYNLVCILFSEAEINKRYKILKYDGIIAFFIGTAIISSGLLDIRILASDFLMSAAIIYTLLLSTISFMKVIFLYIEEQSSLIGLIASETMFFIYVSLLNYKNSYYYIPVYSIIFVISIIALEAYFLKNYVRQFKLLSMQSELMAAEIEEKTAHISEINRNLSQKNKELLENEEARKNIMSNVSHDLRTPITAIRGYAELLICSKDTMSADQRNTYLQNIVKRSQQMERIVSDIVELSRMESNGNNEFSFTEVSISEMLDELYMMYRTDIQGTDKHMRIELPDDDLLLVQADPKKLSRVFENLIANAINYTKDQAEIVIKAWRTGGGDGPEGTGDGALPLSKQRIHITISDNGIGIPKESIPKIFDRFYRAKNSGQNIKGTGLGLSIVKVIIDKHNAEISVDSTLDVGTTFHIIMKAD